MKDVICIQGLGFVGLAMATVVSNVLNEDGSPKYQVYGVDIKDKQSSIDLINSGVLPFQSEDSSFSPKLVKAVLEQKNLIATTDEDVYSKASVVVVDVQLSITKEDKDDYHKYLLHQSSFEKALHSLGKRIKPDCLILLETTIPPGFTRNVAYPIIKAEFSKRGITTEPLIAHSYERVMPGADYLNSICNYFRSFSGLTEESSRRAESFLSSIINTVDYPLYKELEPESTELGKVLENSFRAMNIAFIYEWTLFAEKMGVNLFSVIEGIRHRNSHKNIMMPGLGVGGYCLTKDSLLALWSNDHYYKSSFGLPFSIEALRVNDRMPLHVVDLIRERESIKGKRVLILGVSYREDIGDTRFSPSETLYRALADEGAIVEVNDPYVSSWTEIPDARFVDELRGYDVLIFATRHRKYLSMKRDDLLDIAKGTSLIVDANNIINDKNAMCLIDNKVHIIGVGKGHINKLSDAL